MKATGTTEQKSAAALHTTKLVQRASGLAAAVCVALTMAGTANANLLTNGGFETQDLAGWTETAGAGVFGFSGVECPGPGSGPGFPFERTCDYFAGPVSNDPANLLPTITLSQTFNTVIGGNYVVTFALDPDGSIPSSFVASFNGISLFSARNTPDLPYTLHRVFTTATTTASTIAFTMANPPGFWRLDAVAVDVPEPAPMALLGLGLAGLWFGKRRKS